jgi:hypothetical protein
MNCAVLERPADGAPTRAPSSSAEYPWHALTSTNANWRRGPASRGHEIVLQPRQLFVRHDPDAARKRPSSTGWAQAASGAGWL